VILEPWTLAEQQTHRAALEAALDGPEPGDDTWRALAAQVLGQAPTPRVDRPRAARTEQAKARRKRGSALVAELRVARTFRDEIAAALAPGRWRGFDGPDGVSTHEVVEDVAAALKRYDPAGSP